MSLNSFAHLYEEATIGSSRKIILHTLTEHLPVLRPDMHVLDLASGSGSVTRVIYEHCASVGISPPKITAVDIGPSFVDAFNENKATRAWATATATVGDASNLDMLADDTVDIVIMSFGLFAVPDAVADKTASEMRRVLKPGGVAAVTVWRESWVERMFVGANTAVGRPEEEATRFKIGKWLKMETSRNTLLAGGFEASKIQVSTVECYFKGSTLDDFLDQFSTPFWVGVGASTWTQEQKKTWKAVIGNLMTDKEKDSAEVASPVWLFIATK